MAYKPALHAHGAILNSFLCACSAIVDDFVKVSLVYLEKIYRPEYYH